MESVVAEPKRRGRKRKMNDVQAVTVDGNSTKKVAGTRSLRLVGRYVRKEFQGSGVFLGKVVSYDTGLYRINYEDGDFEDLDSGEVKAFLVEDGDLIGEWFEKKQKLDELLLSKDSSTKVLEENMEELTNVNQMAIEQNNGAGADGEEACGDAEADSSSDSCEENLERDANLDIETPLIPPPELPPSSGHIGIPEEHVSHLLSVHSFLRSFSVSLFLYPFGLDDFVGALNSTVVNTLLDSVHVALMRVLKRHLENLSSDGSELALKCLRFMDWSLLDTLTWPVYLVHYLTVMGYTNGPDWRGFCTHSLERDYYTLSAGRKLMVLQILCDDVLDSEELIAEIDMREESEVGVDIDSSMVVVPTVGPRRVHPRYSKTSAFMDKKSVKGIAENQQIKSNAGGHRMGSQVGPLENSVDEDGNGDECRLCGMDGLLLCCDGCPSSYHARCIGLNKMYMPEGSWYCPECKINATEPTILQGTALKGGDIFGVDPYEQAFIVSCDHLLVLKASSNSTNCLRYYNRSDIPRVLQALYSKAEHIAMYSVICRGIMEYWELPKDILPCNEMSGVSLKLGNQKGSGEASSQLVDLLDKSVPEMTVVENKGSRVTGINAQDMSSSHVMNFVQQSVLSGYSSDAGAKFGQQGNFDSSTNTMKTESASLSGLTGQPVDACELSQQSTSNVTDTVSCTSRNINVDYRSVNGTSLEAKTSLPCLELNRVDRKAYGRQHDGCLYRGSSFKTTSYINHYLHGDFAASAAASLAILSSEENPVPESHSSDNRRKLMSASVSLQVKAFSSAATRFFWPNTEKKLVEVPRERCSWCFSCKAPVASKRGCLLNAAASNAIKGAAKVLAGVRPVKNGDGRLPGIASYIVFMEESLTGLLAGPFRNETFRKQWRIQVEQATHCNAVKILLLELEENIRTIALCGDWTKLADGCSSKSSTSQLAAAAVGSTQKRKPGKRGRKSSAAVEVGDDDCQEIQTDFTWWRGGLLSKLIFQRGALPHAMIKKAARQGGSKKIHGIHYAEGSETPKYSRQLIWRSAVEMSRNMAQLALQVRDLDFHVRWSDLVRPEPTQSDGKGPETEASAFRNAFICDKRVFENETRYCVAFGSQKHLPSRVMKNIAEVEQTLVDGKERYWFSETRIPLYLIKEYEEKLDQNKTVDVPSKLQRRQMKVSRRNIFSYLARKRLGMSDCCSCHQDVFHGNAVKCSACQGFCHEQCATSSTVHMNEEVEFLITCKRCCENRVSTHVESTKGSPTSPLLLQVQEFTSAPPATKKSGKLVGHKGLSKSVSTLERSSQVKSTNSSAGANKSKTKHWGLIRSKKNCEDGTDFRLKHILLRGNPNTHLINPTCRLCNQPYNADLMYVRCETCQQWYHADALELDESSFLCVVGFKCCKCRRIKSPICPYLDPEKKRVLKFKLECKQAPKKEISEMRSDSYVISEHQKEAGLAYSTPISKNIQAAADDPLVSQKRVLKFKIERKQAPKQEISDMGSGSCVISEHQKEGTPPYSASISKNIHAAAADPLLVSLSEAEQCSGDKSEVDYAWNSTTASGPGPQKLPVRRHIQQEKDVLCPYPADPFQVEISAPFEANVVSNTEKLPVRRHTKSKNNLDCYSATNSLHAEVSNPLEGNAVSSVQDSLSPQTQWVGSNGNFDDGITMDYDCLGCDDLEFEPQTYFSFNELLASDDGGRMNANEPSENVVENWEGSSVFPENETFEISYDQEEPMIYLETNIQIVPCKICSHTDPCPDLCCQICGMWMHSHCSPWVESSSSENGWRCGNCREWR